MPKRLVMTPELQQAIKLLTASRQELVEMVREGMRENPILEDSADAASAAPTKITPDVYIQKVDDEYFVVANDDTAPLRCYGAVTVPLRLSIATGELRKSIVGGPPNLASTIALHSPP